MRLASSIKENRSSSTNLIRPLRIFAFLKTQQGVLQVAIRLFDYCRKAEQEGGFKFLKTFRCTPKALPPGCLFEVGQPSNKQRGYRFVPYILFVYCQKKRLIFFGLVNAITPLPKVPVRKERLLLSSRSISLGYS